MEPYLYIVFGLFASMIYVFWKAGSWLASSGRVARETDTLSPADLGALREACESLIADLRSAADESTARVESSIRKAEIVANRLDSYLPDGSKLQVEVQDTHGASQASPLVVEDIEPVHTDPIMRVYQLADQGRSASEIARLEKRPLGEIKLILDLRKLQSQNNPPI